MSAYLQRNCAFFLSGVHLVFLIFFRMIGTIFDTMLTIQNFSVSVGSQEILSGFTHTFAPGTITAIIGHNGSGKTSLALALMGHPRYHTQGKILLDTQEIHTLSPSDRSQAGLFLSFQNIPEIPGIKLLEYLRTIYTSYFRTKNPQLKPPTPFVFRRMVEKILTELHIPRDFLDRDLFVGFSGGEKRRTELVQIELLDPSYIILDEMDSGLDIDAMLLLEKKIQEWKAKNKTILVISHHEDFLRKIGIDQALLLENGRLMATLTLEELRAIFLQGFQR